MKGLMTKTLLAAGYASIVGIAGCDTLFHSLYDPCYPQRYEAAARQEVADLSAPQIQNGHVLDQTVWSYHFEAGTDKLTPGGMEHLAYLARRRPAPDPVIYLQAAQDVSYDPANPEKFAQARHDLDGKRITAVQKYLHAQTAERHVDFQVLVHDPAEPGIAGTPAGVSVQKMYGGSQGALVGGGGAGGATGGAGAAASPSSAGSGGGK